MPNFALKVPPDFDLARDACSYGYFLLAPNRWSPKTRTFTRALALAGGPVAISITQPRGMGGALRLESARSLAAPERDEATRAISRMFRLDESSETIAAFHRLDKRWKRSGRGRLMRSPTLFEDVIKTVTSCNVTWPSTVHMNLRLCEVLGEPSEGTGSACKIHTFPTPQRIAAARPQTLRARCRVGYRDQRIVELARLFVRGPQPGGIDAAWLEDAGTPDDAIHARLLELPGIGPYAAANIMQLLGRFERLPLDTESVRHGRTVLGFKGSSKSVLKQVERHFAPFGPHAFRSYWFELWSFYEKKHGPSYGWERDSTGKLFTASALKEETMDAAKPRRQVVGGTSRSVTPRATASSRSVQRLVGSRTSPAPALRSSR